MMHCSKTALAAWLPLAMLIASAVPARAYTPWYLKNTCPGNLVINGDFESPDPSKDYPPKIYEARMNKQWGWYPTIPGWRPSCKLRVDWQPNKMEIQRRAVATAPEGMQNLELLPNGTGIACQDLNLIKGRTYKLSFYYGLLQTVAWRPPYNGSFVYFYTKAVAAVRDAKYVANPKPGIFPRDLQGFRILVEADTKLPMYKSKQWNKWEVSFVAPSNAVTLAFVTTARPPECGSCGSLLDAVCLQRVT